MARVEPIWRARAPYPHPVSLPIVPSADEAAAGSTVQLGTLTNAVALAIVAAMVTKPS